uniref:HNH endonuclease n=1 Tax=viral metagenome TaxID=1070528 RepID=A0A6M3LLG9_9ZZZZ
MAYAKEYYELHRREIREYQRNYRANNSKWRESNERWNNANRDKMRDYRDNYNRSPKGTYTRLKGRAKHDGIYFGLELNEFLEWYGKQNNKCHYCGKILSFTKGQKMMDGYSVDRKNNDLGYVIDNIVFSCNRCNMAKGSWFTEEQMLEIAKKYFQSGK